MANLIGVGVVGVEAGRSWAAIAHLPALASLGKSYRVVGIANSSAASGAVAASALGEVRAFASVAELLSSDEVDLVVICVKVPHHVALVRAALTAGKHVLCEWPLAPSLVEAEDLAGLAAATGVIAAVGTQAVFAPAIVHLRRLCEDAALGQVLSSTMTGFGMTWGARIDARNGYLLDRKNGATMLTIAVGHALSAIESVLGPIAEVSAALDTRRFAVIVDETGEHLRLEAPDQVLVHCTMASGVPLSLHFRGGAPRGEGLVWQIDGTEGSARVTSPSGLIELAPLTLATSIGAAADWDVAVGPVDRSAVDGVRRLYEALAARIGGADEPLPGFDDAVRLHRIIAAIERSAIDGRRVGLAG